MNARRAALVLAALALGISAPAQRIEPTAPAPTEMRLVPASDPHFRYDGRFDFAHAASPVVIWEASTIAIDFEGERAAVRFSAATGPVFLDATVDGATAVLALRKGEPAVALPLAVSGGGRHHLVLFKRSEASAGTVHFDGLEVVPGTPVRSPTARGRRMKMEFFGDSITVGACDEDGVEDQWEDRRTHDAAFSWAALTAADFAADYRNISISGIGLATGYVDIVMGQVWDRTYPEAASPRADLGAWTPDVVLVLLGDNDDSYPREHALPFPSTFIEKYGALVRAIRGAYPRASIVLLNGGMWAGTHSPALETAWTAAVRALESRDKGISHYTFIHWTMKHPRVADHRQLAKELDDWLRSQAFMARGASGGR